MGQQEDLKKLYEECGEFREYVDKYCKKHRVTVGQAVEHVIVREYASACRESEGEKVKRSTFMPTGECV